MAKLKVLEQLKTNYDSVFAGLIAFFLPINKQVIPILIIIWAVFFIFKRGYNNLKGLFTDYKLVFIFGSLFILYVLGLFYSSNMYEGRFSIEKKLSIILFPILMSTFILRNFQDKLDVLRKFIYGNYVALVICIIGFIVNESSIEDVNSSYRDFSIIHHTSYFSMYLVFSLCVLLKARLLFDGGYYTKAHDLLKSIKPTKAFDTLKDKLEYIYRLGRVHHKMEDYENAIKLYESTIEIGEKLSYYFAANSALELGNLYESQNDYEKAKIYFEKCLEMKDHEYENSLSQKAKAGLLRIKE